VTAAVRALVLAAALVTIAYAALGVAAALALAGVSRSGETARLRTMGLTPRALLALSVAEHGPSTLTAFAAGIGLGVGLFTLLRDALGLAGLTGAPPDVPVVVDPALMLLLLVAMAAVVAAGVLLGTWFGRRLAPATVLRGRFD
jgi:ABC-type antimicrobial peptide transport system permease subunit